MLGFALAFALTNGFLDAAHTIAILIITRSAPPGRAIVLRAAGNLLGRLLVGTAVASAIAGIVTVSPSPLSPWSDRECSPRRRGTCSGGRERYRRARVTHWPARSPAPRSRMPDLTQSQRSFQPTVLRWRTLIVKCCGGAVNHPGFDGGFDLPNPGQLRTRAGGLTGCPCASVALWSSRPAVVSIGSRIRSFGFGGGAAGGVRAALRSGRSRGAPLSGLLDRFPRCG